WLGLRRAAGSAVIYQMLHTFGMLLSFLTAVVLGLMLLPHAPVLVALLAAAFLVLAALTLLLLTGHQRGMLGGALDLLHRTQLVQNALFVVPFEAGTKEGSLYLLFQLLGLDPALGVYTAIVSRVRDLVWIGAGVGLVWLSGRRRAGPAGAATP